MNQWLEKFQTTQLPEIIDRIHPQQVLIFGSQAKGTATDHSDIDVIIIADYFKTIPFVKRMGQVSRTVSRLGKHVDYLCYAPDEFNIVKRQSIVLIDALKNSREIYNVNLEPG